MARVARDEKAALKLVRQRASTQDSFQNFAARVGIGTGNLSDASTYGFNPISRVRTLLEWMYRGSWIVGRVVDCIAEDMTKAGVTWQDQADPKSVERLGTAFTKFQVWLRFQQTTKWARLYGGAICFIEIDGQDPSTPLRLDTVGRNSFRGLTVFDRWMIEPSMANLVQAQGDPDRGLPKFYRVTADAPALPRQTLHHSRCIRLEGVELPYWQKVSENLWGMSVLERLYDRLVAFDSGTQGAAQLLYRAYLRVLSVPQLRELISAGGPAFEGLVKQIQLMRTFQSNEGMSVIDEKDTFEGHAYTFSGVNEVIMQLGQQLCGAAETPSTRLFGESPGGMNASGDSELRNYYDSIEQRQESQYRRGVDVVSRVIAKSEGITLSPGFSFSFNPLWQLDDKEKAEVAKSITETVTSAETTGLVTPAVALKELRQSSKLTNIWSNITDEDIKAAEAQEAPQVQALDDILNRKRGGLAEPGGGSPAPRSFGARGPAAPGKRPDPKAKRPLAQEEGFAGDHLPLMELHGLPLMIETPRGTRRMGDGWSTVMPADYGYIQRTGSAEGADEGMDCFVGPARDSRAAWIVDTMNPDTGEFDEHKVMLGFASERHAMDCFMRAYSDRAGQRIGGVTQMSVDDAAFHEWLNEGDLTQSMSESRRRRRRTTDAPLRAVK